MNKQSNIHLLAFTVSAFIAFVFVGCKKDGPVKPPTITTLAVTEITAISAKSGGNVTKDGGDRVLTRGTIWCTNPDPTIELHTAKTIEGTGTGQFSSDLTSLSVNTRYYVRSYATNSVGIGYGNQVEFITEAGLPPTLTTGSMSGITAISAIGQGEITLAGDTPVTARGVCWSTSTNPTIDDQKTLDGTGTGPFHSYVSGLITNTLYYLRAYATNSSGTSYGTSVHFTPYSEGAIGTYQPCPEMPTVSDVDGNVYNTVLIGDQCWMAQNLKTTRYRDGTSIEYRSDDAQWQNLFSGAFSWSGNDISWKDKYGGLYNWYAVTSPNGICPTGWHVPGNADWAQLTDYHGGIESPNGDKLKSCRQVNSPAGGDCRTDIHPRWDFHNVTVAGINTFGFSALPGGYRYPNGLYVSPGYYGFWWSNDEYSPTNAYFRSLYFDLSLTGSNHGSKSSGHSIRCIRDY